jgi:hypothetical protein
MKRILGALVAAALVVSPAFAGPVSKAQIAQALTSQGYSVQDMSPSMLMVQVGQQKVVVAVSGSDGDVSYITYFDHLSLGDVGHEFLSKFNSEVKFGRAYVDRDGDVTIQMDRNSAGGVNLQNIESDFDVFLLLVSKFLSDLEGRPSA